MSNHELDDIAKPYMNTRFNTVKIDSLSPNQLVSTDSNGLLISGGGLDPDPTFQEITLTNTTNQIHMGTGNTTTINSIAPASTRVVTLPDAGTNSNFVLSQGNQSINGFKTFTQPVTITSDFVSLPFVIENVANASQYVSLSYDLTHNIGIIEALTTGPTAAPVSISPLGAGGCIIGTTALTAGSFLSVSGNSDITGTLAISTLSASGLVATDSNKKLTSTVSALSPAFTGLNLSGLSASGLVATDGSKNLTSSVSSLSPAFTGLNLSSLSANKFIATDGSKNLISSDSINNTEFLEMKVANFNVNSGSFQRIQYSTTVSNNFGGDITITNSGGTFTNSSGSTFYLLVSVTYTVDSLDTGNVQLQIRKNNTTNYGYTLTSPGSTVAPSVATSAGILLANTDFVEIYAQLDSTKTIDSIITIKAF